MILFFERLFSELVPELMHWKELDSKKPRSRQNLGNFIMTRTITLQFLFKPFSWSGSSIATSQCTTGNDNSYKLVVLVTLVFLHLKTWLFAWRAYSLLYSETAFRWHAKLLANFTQTTSVRNVCSTPRKHSESECYWSAPLSSKWHVQRTMFIFKKT